MPLLSRPVAVQVTIPDSIYSQYEGSKDDIDKALIKLLNGTYSGDFEKLPPSKLYSMRLNQKGRIILAKSVIDGLPTLIVVEILINHTYDTSVYLNRLKPWKVALRIKENATEPKYVLDAEGLALVKKTEPRAPRQMLEYGERWLEATIAQSTALESAPEDKTQVICGEAGSGKTLVLMHHIASLAFCLKTEEQSNPKIWVIVPYRALQRHLEGEWRQHSVFHEIEANEQNNPVNFVTPEDFYRRLDDIEDMIEITNQNDFLTWLSEIEFEKIKYLFERISPEQVYQELCVINGLMLLQGTEEWYLKEELNQAFLKSDCNVQALGALKTLLNKYNAYLAENNLFDPNLYQPQNPLPQEDYLFLDESQNLPPGLLSAPHCLIAMNDSQSTLLKRRVNEILLRHIKNNQCSFTQLPGSHRCPQQQIQLASIIDNLGFYIHTKRKHAVTSSALQTSNPDRGLLCFTEGKTPQDVEQLKKSVQDPGTAVVFFTQEGEEAFNRLEIKPLCVFRRDYSIVGLEFSRVILVDPLNARVKEINHIVRNPSKATELPINQIAALELYINEINAALTRSTAELVLVQEKTHGNSALLDHLNKEVRFNTLSALNMDFAERGKAHYQEACDLYQQGHHEMAFNIINFLGQSLQAFIQAMNPAPPENTPVVP